MTLNDFINLVPNCPQCFAKLTDNWEVRYNERVVRCENKRCGYICAAINSVTGTDNIIIRIDDWENDDFYTWFEKSQHLQYHKKPYLDFKKDRIDIFNVDFENIIKLIKNPKSIKKLLILI